MRDDHLAQQMVFSFLLSFPVFLAFCCYTCPPTNSCDIFKSFCDITCHLLGFKKMLPQNGSMKLKK